VEIRFAFPGGGRGEGRSGGTDDFRGPDCIRALADVIRFATGRLADQQGCKLPELVPRMPVLAHNVGVVGSSHGGNACAVVMATHGNEFPGLAFYASMESPYGEGNVNIELGGHDQDLDPAHDPETGQLDLSKLAWSPDLPPGPPRNVYRQASRRWGRAVYVRRSANRGSDQVACDCPRASHPWAGCHGMARNSRWLRMPVPVPGHNVSPRMSASCGHSPAKSREGSRAREFRLFSKGCAS
jgi:hypothetical protein